MSPEALRADMDSALEEIRALRRRLQERLDEVLEKRLELGELSKKYVDLQAFTDALILRIEKVESGNLHIERRTKRGEPPTWTITDGGGSVLNRVGQWEYEPSPSNRTQAFIDRARYTSFEQAEEAVVRYEIKWADPKK